MNKYDVKRLSLYIPSDLLSELKKMKKEVYYDRSYSEMFRDLISIGLEHGVKRNDE